MAYKTQGIRSHGAVNPESACEYRMDTIFACGVLLARAYLQRQMGREKKNFELVPHIPSHTTSKVTNITTKLLKIRGDYDSR